MNSDEVLQLLRAAGALREGHFLLTSGLHSERYFQCARVLQHPDRAAALAAALAERLPAGVDVVIGPALGAVTWAYEVGRTLASRALFAERVDGRMELRRGFAIRPGERVVVVEDVVTSGGSVREVIDLVRACGGVVTAVGCIVDRHGGNPFDVDFIKLASVDVEAWPPERCPACARGEAPAQKPGSRTDPGCPRE